MNILAHDTMAKIEGVCKEYREGLQAETALRIIQVLSQGAKSSRELFFEFKHLPMKTKKGKPDIIGFIDKLYLTYPAAIKILRKHGGFISWNSADTMYGDPHARKLGSLKRWLTANFIYLYHQSPVNGVYIPR